MANRTGCSPRHGRWQQGRNGGSGAAASSGHGVDGGHDDHAGALNGGGPRKAADGGRPKDDGQEVRAEAASGFGVDGGRGSPGRAANDGGQREAADGEGPKDGGQADTGRSSRAGTRRHELGCQRGESGRMEGRRPPPPAAGTRGRWGRRRTARADG